MIFKKMPFQSFWISITDWICRNYPYCIFSPSG